MTKTQAAELIGVSDAAYGRYERGLRSPEWPVVDKIWIATEGQVGPSDLHELPALPSAGESGVKAA